MDYGLGGMRMERSIQKPLTRVEMQVDNLLNGMIMDRKNLKELSSKGN